MICPDCVKGMVVELRTKGQVHPYRETSILSYPILKNILRRVHAKVVMAQALGIMVRLPTVKRINISVIHT